MGDAVRTGPHKTPAWLRSGDDITILPGRSELPPLRRSAEAILQAMDNVDTFSSIFHREVSWLRGRVSDQPGRRFNFLIGGDHSQSLRLLTHMPDAVLVWDAHLDFRTNLHPHAQVLRKLAEAGKDIAIWGARAYSEEEWARAQKMGALVVRAHDPLEPLLDWIQRHRRIYLSVDVDVFPWDSLYPEAGGVLWQDCVRILKALDGRIAGADIVEALPSAAYRVAGLAIHIIAANIPNPKANLRAHPQLNGDEKPAEKKAHISTKVGQHPKARRPSPHEN